MKLKNAIVSACCGVACSASPAAVQKPNVLIIYADDIGRGDLGVWGQKQFTTPNIDRLAAKGMRFDHFYGCTVCAPSRASLLTGNTNAHATSPTTGGLEIQLAAGLITQKEFDVDVKKKRSARPGRYFLGQMAKSAGYHTAYFGKLGVGYTEVAADLDRYGFDHHVGLYDSVICWSYYPEYYWRNGKKVPLPTNPKFSRETPHCPEVGNPDMVYSEDIWLDNCLSYMDERARAGKPFFAIYATQLPHGPASIAPKDYLYKDREGWTEKEKIYASMMNKLDQSVGRLLDRLESLELADNTIVIFLGDNGHEPGTYTRHDPAGIVNTIWDGHHRGEDRFNGTLGQRGIKRFNFEGGLNVPFIVRWPGRIAPDSVTTRRTAIYDVLPTLAEIMDVQVPVTIDGISFLPTLTGKGKQKAHEHLFWINTTGATREAIIVGDWKLIYEYDREKSNPREGRRIYRPALYNMKDDPFEKNDLSAKYPKRVVEMKELIAKALEPHPQTQKK